MFYGLRLMTQGLQRELEHARKLEAISEKTARDAEESSRLQSVFLAKMNHELRTPMNTIMVLGQLLSDSQLDNRQQGFIDNINRSAKATLNLINEVLAITKPEDQSTDKPIAADFDLTRLISRVIKTFADKAKDHGVTLKTDMDKNLPRLVNGYPAQLEQILRQLMGNAIKFGRCGEVTLALTLLNRRDNTLTLQFSVTDQGIGIAKQQQEMIFQSFYQGDDSKTRRYDGSGLGLAVAQKICHQLGSDITVESTFGQGSRFSFQLKFQIVAQHGGDIVAQVESAVDETETAATLSVGTLTELESLLHRLESPLANLQPRPCQDIVRKLSGKQWPEPVRKDIDKLIRLIGKYRFNEALEVVAWLKKIV